MTTFKERAKNDLKTFFNPDVFGDEVSYNSQTIIGVIDYLQDPEIWSQNAACRANVALKMEDAPNIKAMDELSFDSATWIVEKIISADSLVINVLCRKKEGVRFVG